jgi:hypothetical protein
MERHEIACHALRRCQGSVALKARVCACARACVCVCVCVRTRACVVAVVVSTRLVVVVSFVILRLRLFSAYALALAVIIPYHVATFGSGAYLATVAMERVTVHDAAASMKIGYCCL